MLAERNGVSRLTPRILSSAPAIANATVPARVLTYRAASMRPLAPVVSGFFA
jgi:hypothetical protein